MPLNHPPTKSYHRLPLKGARVVWLGVWVLLRLAPPDLTFLSDRQSTGLTSGPLVLVFFDTSAWRVVL